MPATMKHPINWGYDIKKARPMNEATNATLVRGSSHLTPNWSNKTPAKTPPKRSKKPNMDITHEISLSV